MCRLGARHAGDDAAITRLAAELVAARHAAARHAADQNVARAVANLRDAHAAFEAVRAQQRDDDRAERQAECHAAAERRAAILRGTRPVASANPIEHVLARLHALGAAARAQRAERESARAEMAASLHAILAARARDAA